MAWLGLIIAILTLVASIALVIQRARSRRQLERAAKHAQASQRRLGNKINELATLMGAPPQEKQEDGK